VGIGDGAGDTTSDGWRADPFRLHEERFFKDGEPTPLVRDDGIGSYDEPPARGAPPVAPRRRRGAADRPSPAFVLVHSPLVGPASWRWVAQVLEGWGFEVLVPSLAGFAGGGPRYWEPCVQAVVLACEDVPGPLVLTGAGEAGPLLPAMALALLGRVRHIGFVDAPLPPLRGFAECVPSWLRKRLAAATPAPGAPRRLRWWDDGALDKLDPYPDRRRVVEDELPAVPLDYLDLTVPVPDGWCERVRCSYLWFSDDYEADAREAERRRWRVRRLAGRQLTMVARPKAVARELFWTAVR
jgi:hypothetical protein